MYVHTYIYIYVYTYIHYMYMICSCTGIYIQALNFRPLNFLTQTAVHNCSPDTYKLSSPAYLDFNGPHAGSAVSINSDPQGPEIQLLFTGRSST